MPSENILTRVFGANDFAVGEVVHVTGDRAVQRAQANAPANVSGALGLSLGWTTVFAGIQEVLLEAGLAPAPVAGETLFVSDTQPGRATNVAPALAVALGSVLDASKYADTDSVVMVLCCGGGGGGVTANVRDGKVSLAGLGDTLAPGNCAGFNIPFPGAPFASTAKMVGLLDQGDQQNCALSWNVTVVTNTGFTFLVSNGGVNSVDLDGMFFHFQAQEQFTDVAPDSIFGFVCAPF